MATANEIEIRVTVDDKTRAPFQKIENKLRQDANRAGERAGNSFSDGFNKGFSKLNTGGGFGRFFGSAATGGIKGIVSAFTGAFDLIRSGFTSVGQTASQALGQMTGGLASAAQSVVTLGSTLAVVGAVAGPALVGISTLAAAIGGTLLTALTGAVGALGLFSARAREAFTGLGDFVQAEMGKLAESSGLAQALVDVAGQLRQAFINLRPAISDLMAAAAPQMRTLAQGFIDLAQNAIPGFQAAIRNSGPVIEGFRAMLASLGTGIGGFFEQMSLHAEGFKQTFQGIGAIFEQTLPALGNFIGLLADQLGPVLQQLAPALTNMINQLGPLLAQAIQQVGPLMPGLIDGFTQVMAAAIPLIPPLTELAVSVLPPLATAIQAAGNFITGVLVPAFNAIMPVVNAVLAGINLFIATLKAAGQAMVGDFAGAQQTLVAAGQQFAVAMGQNGQAAATGFSTPIQTGLQQTNQVVSNNIGQMVSTITSGTGQWPGIATNNTNGFRNSVQGGLQSTVGVVQSGVSSMVSAITSQQGRFQSAGSSLANSFRQGWVAAANAAVAAVRRTVSQIAALLPGSPAKKGPFSGRGYTKLRGMRMVLDFAKGIRARARSSVAAALAMARRLAGMFGIDLFGGRGGGRGGGGGGGGGFRPPVAKPAFTPYKGAGAPSPSMLAEHHARQKAAMRNSGRGSRDGGRGFHFSGDLDSAMACAIMRLIREGKLRIA
jgi:phage-related protein